MGDLKDSFKKPHLLHIGWAYADYMEKSTEWMLTYMSNFAEVDYDEVVDFVIMTDDDERDEWFQRNPHWLFEHDNINQDELKSLN